MFQQSILSRETEAGWEDRSACGLFIQLSWFSAQLIQNRWFQKQIRKQKAVQGENQAVGKKAWLKQRIME